MFFVAAQDCFREIHKQTAMGYAGIAGGCSQHRLQIVNFAVMLAARTEQLRVAGRSIKTSVQRRDAPRQQLDLGMRDRPEFPAEIAHLERSQILVLA